MGLFDSVIGALGHPAGGSGGQPDLINAVIGLLGQAQGQGQAGGGLGGLAGLVSKFQQGGLGDIVDSWVGTGKNMPVSTEQLSGVLGNDTVASLAQQLGTSHGDMLSQLSQMLPQVVDKLTPGGQLPAGGGLGDLAGLFSGLNRH